jgi:ferredoxin
MSTRIAETEVAPPGRGTAGRAASRRGTAHHLRVNPIACKAHGMCAELLPERIALDEWGYPVLDGQPLTPDLLAHARRAAQACPTFALLLERRGQ